METGNKLLIVLAASVVAAAIGIAYFTEAQIQQTEQQIFAAKDNEAEMLASRTVIRLEGAATIIEITSKLPDMTHVSDADAAGQGMFGIPENAEVGKRTIARDILSTYPNYEYLYFLLPDGDVYFLEPFDRQLDLTTGNFAFRDYYEKVMDTRATYLSEKYISNNSGRNVASITTPVYSSDGELIGIWGGALNLDNISHLLSQLNFGANSRFIYVDQNGQKVADSNLQLLNTNESFSGLQSVQNALAGGSGHLVESVGGTNMLVAYRPVNILSNTWVVLSIQPYDDAFAPLNLARAQTGTMIALLFIIAGAFGVFMQKSFRSMRNLANDLENSNLELVQKEKEMERINEELVHVEKSKNEFISMMSHELKTPLVPIKGFAQILLKPGLVGDLNAKQKDAVQAIIRNCDGLEALVRDVLSVYKLDMGKMTFSKVDIDVAALVDRNIADFQSLMTDKHIEIQSDVRASGRVFCDPIRIDQVLGNLIKNSVDFVPPKDGRITIRAEQGEDSQVVFTVEDNGPGIPADKADKLFQKFYQIDTSATRKHGGTGLGLSICKGIIEAHGGRIWIDKTYTKGTCVKFTLPISNGAGKQ